VKAILWPYKYKNMRKSWYLQMTWIVNALFKYGITVKKHKDFICQGLDFLPLYNYKEDKSTDICIYNHADISHLTGDILLAKTNWFFKPTVPDEYHSTLDILGYGPYSSVTYNKPNFEVVDNNDVDIFFNTKVKKWIENKSTKWGGFFENKEQVITDKGYFLVLGQVGGDEVVTRHDFGSYFLKLEAIIKELLRISNKKIIVKLHPYTDGINARNTKFSDGLKKRLKSFSNRVAVYTGKTNIHNFIKNCECVFLSNSDSGFEAMMHKKPIISFGFPAYHWVAYDLRHLSDLIRAIKLDWFDLNKQNKFLYWYLEKYCFYNQQTAIRRVKELLDGRLPSSY